jgi:hypothetical protein
MKSLLTLATLLVIGSPAMAESVTVRHITNPYLRSLDSITIQRENVECEWNTKYKAYYCSARGVVNGRYDDTLYSQHCNPGKTFPCQAARQFDMID